MRAPPSGGQGWRHPRGATPTIAPRQPRSPPATWGRPWRQLLLVLLFDALLLSGASYVFRGARGRYTHRAARIARHAHALPNTRTLRLQCQPLVPHCQPLQTLLDAALSTVLCKLLRYTQHKLLPTWCSRSRVQRAMHGRNQVTGGSAAVGTQSMPGKQRAAKAVMRQHELLAGTCFHECDKPAGQPCAGAGRKHGGIDEKPGSRAPG